MPNLKLTIHSVFCNSCGGMVKPVVEVITDHESFIKCDSCDEILLMVRTVEDDPRR